MPAYGMGKKATILPYLHSFVDVLERERRKHLLVIYVQI